MAVSKPLPGTLIDPASPWARGLVVAVVGNQQGARVDNYAPALNRTSGVGTDLQTVSSPLGGALKFNGSTAVANFGTNANLSGTGKFCVAFRMNVRGLVRANFPTIYSSGYNGVEVNLIIYFSANLADGRLFLQVANALATGKTNTNFELAANQNRWFDVYVEFGGGTTGNIKVNGVNDYTVFGTQTRKTGFRNTTLGCIDLNGTNGRFSNVEIDYLYHWENRTLGAQEYEALRSNPWQLWPDEQQLVFAPVTTFTGTATSSQAQTAAATGLAGNIGTATSSQAQTAAATGLSGYIGTATASQAQTANATGLAGVIGNATSSQAQSATGAGAETYNGNATSSQAQTAEAVGIAGVIGTATTSQAQTSDAIGVAGIVGTATSSQAQTVNGAGNNGQLSVQFGGHIAQPQYIHVPMFARGTGKATCKSKPHVRVLTRALAIGRSKGTCRPLVRQYMAGRAVGASAQVISSMRLQYNETWHAQRARDDQSLLFGF